MIQVFLGCEKSRRHPWVTTEWYIHNTIPWISDVIKHLRNISSLVLFIWMPEVWNTELLCQLWKTSTSFLFSQNTVPFAGFCSLFHHQAEGEVCRDFSVWCRVHNCRAKYQVAVSFPCLSFFFFFQKSLRTLSQLHQKVSSDSYFLFKRRETICVAINFLSRLFYIVKTNQNSLLKNHCFLPAWTKYSLKCHSFQAHNCPADSSDKDN